MLTARVFVRRGPGPLELFPADAAADGSALGRQVFSLADRLGDGGNELSFLSTECGASNCAVQVVVLRWSPEGWISVGPEDPFENPDRIEWQGKGAKTVLLVHAGMLATVGAGPPRATLQQFAFSDGEFREQSAVPDPPVYLFHAILDADAKFAAGDFAGAVTAYRAAIADPKLLDWRQETGQGNGRSALVAYAMFRVAVALAANGNSNAEVSAALDRVITQGQVDLFGQAASAFRRGWQEDGNAHAGCSEATSYLRGVDGLVRDMFDYGYGNPRKSALDICPL
jgi:hypothetical protein